MAAPLGVVDALVSLAGPFLIPVVLFALGAVGYAVLVALGRAGVVGDRSGGETPPDDETDWRGNE